MYYRSLLAALVEMTKEEVLVKMTKKIITHQNKKSKRMDVYQNAKKHSLKQ